MHDQGDGTNGSTNFVLRGDEKIVAEDGGQYHDCLALRAGWGAYVEGYLRAGDALVAHSLSTRIDQDVLGYPILFLYRHYMELRTKSIIAEARAYLGEQGGMPQGHQLRALWGFCRPLIERIFTDEPMDQIEALEGCILQFADLDPRGTAFRYAVGLSGERSMSLARVNVRNLHDVVRRMALLLDSIDHSIWSRADWEREQRREMEAEYLRNMEP